MPRPQATQTKSTYLDNVQIEDVDPDVTDDDDWEIDDADLEDLDFIVNDKAWDLLKVDAPSWYMNPQFKVVFKNRDSYDSIAICSPFEYATGLFEVLTSAAPPSIDFFMSLPSALSKTWSIYVVVYEKRGCKPKLYIGSGTKNSSSGIATRLRNHENHSTGSLAKEFNAAVKDGYKLVHSAVICWTAMPPEHLSVRVRARFLLLESVFTCLFHAKLEMQTDVHYKKLVIWDRKSVAWEPMCTHRSPKEKISGKLDMTEAEARKVASIKRQRRRDNDKKLKRKMRKEPKILARLKLASRIHYAKHRVEIRQAVANKSQKTVEEKQFYCKPCEYAAQNPDNFERHLHVRSHKNKVAGIGPSDRNLRKKAARESEWQPETTSALFATYLVMVSMSFRNI